MSLTKVPETLVDFQLFADGYGLLGSAPRVKLPVIREIYEEEDLPGAATTQKVFMSQFEQMECEFTLRGLDLYTLGLVGQDNILFTLRGAIQQREGLLPVVPIVAYMTGRLYEVDTQEIERKSLTQSTCKIDIRHYKLTRAGTTIYEIAADGSIVVINGRDIRGLINAAIGNLGGLINGILG